MFFYFFLQIVCSFNFCLLFFMLFHICRIDRNMLIKRIITIDYSQKEMVWELTKRILRVRSDLSASGNGESREAQSGHEPQQHYDNLAAHGLGLRCLHCKYNNNVHACQENRGKSDGWGRKSYDAACSWPDVVKYILRRIAVWGLASLPIVGRGEPP